MQNKILIIDDNQDILDLTELILRDKGYEVKASLTADILEDILLINPVLILLDEWLKDSSGHKICEKLKSTKATQHFKIVLFSAINGLKDIAEHCMADSYIEKPFDIENLLDTINNLLLPVKVS